MGIMKKLFANNLVKSAAICGLMLAPFMQSNAASRDIAPNNIISSTINRSHNVTIAQHNSPFQEFMERGTISQNTARHYTPATNMSKFGRRLNVFSKTPMGRAAMAFGLLGGAALLNKDWTANMYNNICEMLNNHRTKKDIMFLAQTSPRVAKENLEARLNYLRILVHNNNISNPDAAAAVKALEEADNLLYKKSCDKNNVDKTTAEIGKIQLQQKWQEIHKELKLTLDPFDDI